MKRKEHYEICRHVKEVGQLAVYVLPTCRNATMIKGTLVSSKNRCRKCEFWEDRDEEKTMERNDGKRDQ